MKAMVLEEIGNIKNGSSPLVYRDIEKPEPSDDDILIKVVSCGVCHTEIDQIEGRIKPSLFPVIPGHQITGYVEDKGSNVSTYDIGNRVGVAWINSSCGICKFCLSGLENLCKFFKATGKDANGGFAEYTIVNEKFAVRIPDNLDLTKTAPHLCAGAIGYRSLNLCNHTNSEPLGLVGFGSSGHIVLKLSKIIYPDSPVFVFARSEEQREFAMDIGAEWSGEINAESPCELKSVIDTTPVWNPVVESLRKLDRNGRLVINAIRKMDVDKDCLLNLNYQEHLWLEKEIKSVTNVALSDVENFLKVASDNYPDLEPQIKVYSLDNLNEAIIELKEGSSIGSKVVNIY